MNNETMFNEMVNDHLNLNEAVVMTARGFLQGETKEKIGTMIVFKDEGRYNVGFVTTAGKAVAYQFTQDDVLIQGDGIFSEIFLAGLGEAVIDTEEFMALYGSPEIIDRRLKEIKISIDKAIGFVKSTENRRASEAFWKGISEISEAEFIPAFDLVHATGQEDCRRQLDLARKAMEERGLTRAWVKNPNWGAVTVILIRTAGTVAISKSTGLDQAVRLMNGADLVRLQDWQVEQLFSVD